MRKVVSPAIYPFRMKQKKRGRIERELLKNLSDILVEDPIIMFPEMQGEFHLDPRSDIFKRIVTSHRYEPKLVEWSLSLVDTERDVLDIGGLVGTVKAIGLRTSTVETRDSITVVVPNSKLVTDNVINWSHFDEKVRFKVGVGVAYGSDTKLVKKILLKIAADHPSVNEKPNPLIRFTNFGDSSLDFELHFFSRNFIHIEDVKSDLRFEIDNAFRENNVEIPFPQRVVWMKGGGESAPEKES